MAVTSNGGSEELTPAEQHLKNLAQWYGEELEETRGVEDDIHLVTYIQITRVYDVLLALLREQNPDAADTLVEYHERGEFISPPPAYSPDNDNP